jgi:hypothetical protein
MKKFNILSFFAGVIVSLLAFVAISSAVYLKSYTDRITSLGPTTINYMKSDECIATADAHLSIDLIMHLSPKESIYFGKVSEDEYIDIYVRLTANIRIYPHTKDSVIVEYDPIGIGFTERYVVKSVGFEYYLQEIYSFTGNEDFNVYPEN